MKKLIPLVVAGLLIAAMPFVIASAGAGDDEVKLDENGKIIGEAIPFDEASSIKLTREQAIQYQEQLKRQAVIGSQQNPGSSCESGFTDEEIAILNEKARAAEERAEQLRALFSSGMEIVGRYYPGMFAETVDDLQAIDRDMLEAMVNVLSTNQLSLNDEVVLKQCLAEKYFIVLETDPLYEQIIIILGLGD
ncbi:MAG: hypothetical protein PUK25_01590 [Clostridiales bacterium]|nr:hypothetical protein [Clostridiales bacterium]MDD7488360.1 hypothetical protein [Clostridiales bacterium]MDY5702448.1 hypothetical protein [Eubacteriales bacterium]